MRETDRQLWKVIMDYKEEEKKNRKNEKIKREKQKSVLWWSLSAFLKLNTLDEKVHNSRPFYVSTYAEMGWRWFQPSSSLTQAHLNCCWAVPAWPRKQTTVGSFCLAGRKLESPVWRPGPSWFQVWPDLSSGQWMLGCRGCWDCWLRWWRLLSWKWWQLYTVSAPDVSEQKC